MEKLLLHIQKNYNISIESKNEIDYKTINDIYYINTDKGRFVVKLFNVDSEQQINLSTLVQNIAYLDGLAPNILKNSSQSLYTIFEQRYYTVQEYIIAKETEVSVSYIRLLARSIALLHKVLEKVNPAMLINKMDVKTFEKVLHEIQTQNELIQSSNLSQTLTDELRTLISLRLLLLKKYSCAYIPKISHIIHGDLRPSNLLFNEHIYFIDFDYVALGDLLFEIGSASMLLTDYSTKLATIFIEEYNSYTSYGAQSNYVIFMNLLSYYVQSSYPLKLVGRIDDLSAIEIIKSRYKALIFCDSILSTCT